MELLSILESWCSGTAAVVVVILAALIALLLPLVQLPKSRDFTL